MTSQVADGETFESLSGLAGWEQQMASEKRKPGRPSGTKCPWLAEWARTFLEEKGPRSREILAEWTGKDASTVSRYLKGETGIDAEDWRRFVFDAQHRGEITEGAAHSFNEQLQRTLANLQGENTFALDEAFEPIQSRLVAALEGGETDCIDQAFRRALGLLAAWGLSGRRFSGKQLVDGLPRVVRRVQRWFYLAVSFQGERYRLWETAFKHEGDFAGDGPPDDPSDLPEAKLLRLFELRFSWWAQSFGVDFPDEVRRCFHNWWRYDGTKFGEFWGRESLDDSLSPGKEEGGAGEAQ